MKTLLCFLSCFAMSLAFMGYSQLAQAQSQVLKKGVQQVPKIMRGGKTTFQKGAKSVVEGTKVRNVAPTTGLAPMLKQDTAAHTTPQQGTGILEPENACNNSIHEHLNPKQALVIARAQRIGGMVDEACVKGIFGAKEAALGAFSIARATLQHLNEIKEGKLESFVKSSGYDRSTHAALCQQDCGVNLPAVCAGI